MLISRLFSETACVGHVALPAGTSVPFGRISMYSAHATALSTLRNHFDGAHCLISTGVALLIVGVASVRFG